MVAFDDGRSRLAIVDRPELGRYDAELDGAVVGRAEYRLDGTRMIVPHTEIDPSLEGRGLGSRMVELVLDDIRRRRLTVRPDCPFVAAWIRSNPAYADLWPERLR